MGEVATVGNAEEDIKQLREARLPPSKPEDCEEAFFSNNDGDAPQEDEDKLDLDLELIDLDNEKSAESRTILNADTPTKEATQSEDVCTESEMKCEKQCPSMTGITDQVSTIKFMDPAVSRQAADDTTLKDKLKSSGGNEGGEKLSMAGHTRKTQLFPLPIAGNRESGVSGHVYLRKSLPNWKTEEAWIIFALRIAGCLFPPLLIYLFKYAFRLKERNKMALRSARIGAFIGAGFLVSCLLISISQINVLGELDFLLEPTIGDITCLEADNPCCANAGMLQRTVAACSIVGKIDPSGNDCANKTSGLCVWMDATS